MPMPYATGVFSCISRLVEAFGPLGLFMRNRGELGLLKRCVGNLDLSRASAIKVLGLAPCHIKGKRYRS